MLDSLEIVNEFIKNIEETMKEIKSGPFYDIRLLDLKKFKTIKQDLEKYSKVMELLKELFKEIETDKLTIMSSGKPEIIKYCLVRLEPYKMKSMHINENTYNIVEKLKELVGDDHD